MQSIRGGIRHYQPQNQHITSSGNSNSYSETAGSNNNNQLLVSTINQISHPPHQGPSPQVSQQVIQPYIV